MAKTFTQMKTNVGNMCMDTSSALATLIGRWLNDKYQDVWNRRNWSDLIRNDYNLITVAEGTATSCTADASTDYYTASAHGLYNGDIITFAATTIPTGLTAGKNYYVINKTTNTFQVSLSEGGTAINITSAGTTVTFTFKARSIFDLPLDFDVEMHVANLTDGYPLDRFSEGGWWEERNTAYNTNVITPGGFPTRYLILYEHTNNAETGYGVIRLDPPVNDDKIIAIPYKRKFEDLISVTGTATTDTANKVIASASTFITSLVKAGMRIKNTTDISYGTVISVDSETQLTCDRDVCPDGNEAFEISTTPIIRDIEYILEYGAISETFAYKKNFSKASDFAQKYEYELSKRIGRENTKPNQRYQWIPEQRNPSAVTPFTGWNSYDSL